MNEIEQKPQPPARLNERNFRRFEKTLFQVVTTFPKPIVVTTQAPNAFACQLRNAMKSLYAFQWQTTIPHTRFLALYEQKEIVVREQIGKVIIGSRQTTRDPIPEESGLIIKQHGGEFHSFGRDSAFLLCCLADKRLLTQPVRIEGMTADDAQNLQQQHDILLERQEDGSYILT